ncbi:MAG: cell wall hydrolase [Sneathiella sp.]|nr:cell wall hydrolase [Sneathiella sp.]
MIKQLWPFSMSYRSGLWMGAAAIVMSMTVSFTLLFSIGTRDDLVRTSYLKSKYNISSPQELETKLASLGRASIRGMNELKNLDMPTSGPTEATIKNVDLFERVFSGQELCLAQAVYFEARGEPLIGQVAIAEVVLNRVATKRYPNTVCDVVFQNQHMSNRCQFSFACDGKSDRPRNIRSWERSLKIVALVMAGERSGVAKKATHYHASYVSPRWRLSLDKVGEIGRHIFYRSDVI